MFKIIGGAAVMLASLVWGIKKYNEFYERKRILCQLRDGARKIKNDLVTMCRPLHESFYGAGEIFSQAAKMAEESLLPSEAVLCSAQKVEWLRKGDIECISRFADGLSACDKDGQISNIDLFCRELDELIEKAKSELETKGVLFIKGSILMGAAVVLILL